MDKKEAIAKIKSELEGLHSYAEDIRGDWSGFNGRDLLRQVNYFKSKVEEYLKPLEEGVQ